VIALEFGEHRWSDTDFHGQVQAAALNLQARSTGPNHIEFIDAHCTPETIWKVHACRIVGTQCVMVAPTATAKQRQHIHTLAQTTIPNTPNSAWLWIPTSGTTGSPRLIGLSQQQLQASADASQERLGHNAADRWLCCLPLHHIGGLSIALRTVSYETTMVLHSCFDAAAVSDAIDEDGITQVSMVPTMLKRILDHRQDRPFPAHLRFILLGGAPASPALIDRCRPLQAPIAITWGMTETASQVATRIPGDLRPDADVGHPLLGMTVAVNHGQLVVRGPIAHGGEYTTSDRGCLDEQGRVIVYGRGADLIISGGENIDPNTIERAIEQHPNIEECAVVGRVSEEWGERPIAFVVGTRTEHLSEWLTDKLQKFQQPDEFIWLNTLPRTAMGKLDRAALVQQSQGSHRLGEFSRD
jgi:O-succinylbenzoic acid--CoA ligase